MQDLTPNFPSNVTPNFPSNGLSFQISASRMKGKADGSETIWDNTLVTASDTLSVSSGRDTTLRGAQVAGQSVLFDVGGKLLVETLQDNSLYASRQTSSGFNLSICWFFCVGTPVTGSIGSSSQKIKHSYLSAVGQSGIAAGEGGFDIRVRGETELIGAALTSSATVEKNRLSTASLASRDLDNAQRTKASSSSISLAYGGFSALTTLAGNATANLLANLNGNAALPKNQNETSQTLSIISPATITLTGSGNAETDEASRQTVALLTSRDPATANAPLTNTLTLQQAQVLEREIVRARENQEAAQMVGAVLANVVGDVAAKMQQPVDDARARQYLDGQAKDRALTPSEQRDLARLDLAGVTPEKAAQTLADPVALATAETWKDGSPAKIALHGMVGLIESKIGNGSAAAGVLGGMSQEAMAPILAQYLVDNGFVAGSGDYKALMELGATLAGTAIGALASGTQGAASGATAAFVGVRNNFLSHPEATQREAAKQRLQTCGSDEACKQDAIAEIAAWNREDISRDEAMKKTCMSPSSPECLGWYSHLLAAKTSYDDKTLNISLKNELAEINTLNDLISARLNNLTSFNVGAGTLRSVSGAITAPAELLALSGKALTGDAQAQDDLKKIVNGVGEFLGDIPGSIERGIKTKIDQANQLEAQGRTDEATQIRSQLVTDGALIVTGMGTLAVKGTGALAKFGDNALSSAVEQIYLRSLKIDAGAIKGFKRAEEINALMTSAEWLPSWKSGTTVAEATLQPGTTVRMVVDEINWNAIRDGKVERAFGGWATFDDVPNQAYVRNQLAITPAMKPTTYLIEVEITRPVNAQIGVVGKQGGASGGGNQVHFIVEPMDRSGVLRYVSGSGRALP